MRQLEHHEVKTQKHSKDIVVIVENVTSPENVGMIFRISEAMGVSKIYLVGTTPTTPNKKISKTARTTDRKVENKYCESSTPLIQQLTHEGYSIFALEITDKSQNINSVNFKKIKKIAIVIGSESNGINAVTLECIKNGVMIPLFGTNSSINVVNALSIALFEIVRN